MPVRGAAQSGGPERRRAALVVAGVGLAVAVLYAATLMVTISGCGEAYCVDTGEFQVALAEWGTVHYTGYPLYMLLGSPFVAALRWAGVPPAAGASVYSMVWQLAAVMGLAALTYRLTGSAWLAVGAGLLCAALRPVWIHGTLPEVYSLSLALGVGLIWLVADLLERWEPRRARLLALVAGASVAHHRAMALLLLPAGVLLAPVVVRRRPSWRWVLVAGLCFLAGFLPYLDLPLRIRLGTTWHYGNPGTWDGFWDIFLAREVRDLQQARLGLGSLMSSLRGMARFFVDELSWPGCAAVAVGWALALWRAVRGAERIGPLVWLLSAAVACFSGFALVFPRAVLLDAVMLLPLLALVALAALGYAALGAQPQRVAGLLLLALAGFLMVRGYPAITGLTRDRSSVDYIERVAQLDAPPGSVVVAPWGNRYFALAYAQRVEGRFPAWTIVDHRADLPQLAEAAGGVVYTADESLYILDGRWWRARLGESLHISSAGPGMLALAGRALAQAGEAGYPLGDGIGLVRWEIRRPAPERMSVVLWWTATQPPAQSYSTYIHVTDRDEIVAPEDLIGQSDFSAAVYGRYPVTEWQPGELVREDHEIVLAAGRDPRTVLCGMYSRDAEGHFVKLGQVALAQDGAGEWRIR